MLVDAVLDERTTNALKDHATLGKTAIPRTKPIVLLLVSKQAWDSFEAHFRVVQLNRGLPPKHQKTGG